MSFTLCYALRYDAQRLTSALCTDEKCPHVNVNLRRDPLLLLFSVSCPPRNCDTVDDCGDGQICCDIGCSRRCMRPPVYDERCPLPVAPVSDITCEMECASNSDCESDRMCCGLYCGSQCTPMSCKYNVVGASLGGLFTRSIMVTSFLMLHLFNLLWTQVP